MIIDIYVVFLFENKEKKYRYMEIAAFGLINYITLIYRAESFMEAYKLCYKTDQKLTQLGIELDFRVCRWTIFVLYVLSVGSYSSALVLFFISDQNHEMYLWEIFAKGIPAVIMTGPMYNFMSFGSLICKRFQELNKLIKDQLCVNSTRVNIEVVNLAQMHSDLCKSSNAWIYAHEYSLLTYYVFTFVQLGEFVLNLMGYYQIALSSGDILYNTVFILSNVLAMVLMTIWKYESTLTGPALCELREAYSDEAMNEQVSNFIFWEEAGNNLFS